VNKIDRVTRALKGEEVDRPPFSFWYHFGLQHGPGRKHAEAELDFYRAYDLDFLKVMNDYPYPLPAGVEEYCDEACRLKVTRAHRAPGRTAARRRRRRGGRRL